MSNETDAVSRTAEWASAGKSPPIESMITDQNRAYAGLVLDIAGRLLFSEDHELVAFFREMLCPEWREFSVPPAEMNAANLKRLLRLGYRVDRLSKGESPNG